MRRSFSLAAAACLVILTLSGLAAAQAPPPYPSDIRNECFLPRYAVTQADVNAVGANNCTVVYGDLIFRDQFNGDLSPLAVVEVVWGSLEFRGTNLTNTVGLHNVVNVLNNLQFLDNLLLTQINLDSLNGTKHSMVVSNNPLLSDLDSLTGTFRFCGWDCLWYDMLVTNLDFLVNLEYVGDDFRFRRNANLADISGLAKIASEGHIAEDITLDANPLLEIDDLEVFSTLTRVNKGLQLIDMPGITTMNPWRNVEYLGWLEVRNLTNLPSLDALASLTTIHESLELAFNDLMTEISIPNLSYIGTALRLRDTSLTTAAGLDGVVVGDTHEQFFDVYIERNPVLTAVDCLQNTTRVRDVIVQENDALASLLLPSARMTNKLTVLNNTGLIEIDFRSMETINNPLILTGNPDLVSARFDALNATVFDILVENNPSLLEISFPSLTTQGNEIADKISVAANAALVNVSFASLVDTHNIIISENAALVTVDLPSLVAVHNLLRIADCHGPLAGLDFPSLANVTDDIVIEYNTMGGNVTLPALLACWDDIIINTNTGADAWSVDAPALFDFREDLRLWWNTEMVSFSAPLVTAFGEVGLEVHGNADLEVLDLPLLVNVTGYVIVHYNNGPFEFYLPALERVTNYVQFLSNTAIPTISMPSLASVGAWMQFVGNSALSNLVVPSLPSLSQWLEIRQNNAMTNLGNWGSLDSVHSLYFSYLPALGAELNGMPSLATVTSVVHLQGLPVGTNQWTVLENLATPIEHLYIYNMDGWTDLTVLDDLPGSVVSGNTGLRIEYNPDLTTLGFSITSLEYLVVANNANLLSLGLASLSLISTGGTGDVVLRGNNAVTSYDLPALTTANKLIIVDNLVLSGLTLSASLNINNVFVVTHNPGITCTQVDVQAGLIANYGSLINYENSPTCTAPVNCPNVIVDDTTIWAFAGCTHVTGSLTIAAAKTGTLAGLESIVSVANDILIQYTQLTSLSGLDNLETARHVYIRYNAQLTTFGTGFGAFHNATGNFYVVDDDLLTVVGLPALVWTQSMWIQNNDALVDATLPSFEETTTGEFRLQNNPVLRVANYPSLRRTGYHLQVLSNALMHTLSFPSLVELTQVLYINSNPALNSSMVFTMLNTTGPNTHLYFNYNYEATVLEFPANPSFNQIQVRESKVSSLTFGGAITGGLYLHSNYELETLSVPRLADPAGVSLIHWFAVINSPKLTGHLDLSGLTTMGSYLYFRSTGLQSVNAANLTSVGAYVYFFGNPDIEYINAPQLTTVSTFFYIHSSNPTWVDFSSLASVGQYVRFYNTRRLTEVSLPSLTSVARYLYLDHNDDVVNFSVPLLTELTWPDNPLMIQYNDHLKSVSLPSLGVVNQAVRIEYNYQLETVDLAALHTVRLGLSVFDNFALTTLRACNLSAIGGSLNVWQNHHLACADLEWAFAPNATGDNAPVVRDCEPLCTALVPSTCRPDLCATRPTACSIGSDMCDDRVYCNGAERCVAAGVNDTVGVCVPGMTANATVAPPPDGYTAFGIDANITVQVWSDLNNLTIDETTVACTIDGAPAIGFEQVTGYYDFDVPYMYTFDLRVVEGRADIVDSYIPGGCEFVCQFTEGWVTEGPCGAAFSAIETVVTIDGNRPAYDSGVTWTNGVFDGWAGINDTAYLNLTYTEPVRAVDGHACAFNGLPTTWEMPTGAGAPFTDTLTLSHTVVQGEALVDCDAGGSVTLSDCVVEDVAGNLIANPTYEVACVGVDAVAPVISAQVAIPSTGTLINNGVLTVRVTSDQAGYIATPDCHVNTKNVTFGDSGGGVYDLVMVIDYGDPFADTNLLPVDCGLVDAGGNRDVLPSILAPSPKVVACHPSRDIFSNDNCIECPAGWKGNISEPDMTCTECPSGTYFRPLGFQPDVPCNICPEGGWCEGSDILPVADDGWWEESDEGWVYVYGKCFPASICLRGNVCADGHTGDACAACIDNYYQEEGICKECPKAAVWVMIGLITFIVIFSFALVKVARKSTVYFTSLSVGFNFIQVVAVLAAFDLNWPEFVLKFFRALEIFNFDLNLFQPECALAGGDVAFFLIWILKLSVPLLFVVIFILGQVAMSCYYHCRRATCCDERRSKCWSRLPKLSYADVVLGRNSSVNAMITVLVLLYLMLVNTTLTIFKCDDEGRMESDVSVACGGEDWNKMLWIAIISIFVYGLGIPVAFWAVLYINRLSLFRELTLVKFGLMYRRYRKANYWWELVILFRKMGIVVGLALFDDVGAAVLALVTMIIALIAHLRAQPYLAHRVNNLETINLICSCIVLVVGIALAAVNKTGDEIGITVVGIFVIIIVVLNCIAILVVLGQELRFQYNMVTHGVRGGLASDEIVVNDSFFELGIFVQSQTRNLQGTTASLVLTSKTAVNIECQLTRNGEIINEDMGEVFVQSDGKFHVFMARFMEPGFFTFLIDAEPLMAGRQRSAIQRGVRTSTIMLDDLDFTADTPEMREARGEDVGPTKDITNTFAQRFARRMPCLPDPEDTHTMAFSVSCEVRPPMVVHFPITEDVFEAKRCVVMQPPFLELSPHIEHTFEIRVPDAASVVVSAAHPDHAKPGEVVSLYKRSDDFFEGHGTHRRAESVYVWARFGGRDGITTINPVFSFSARLGAENVSPDKRTSTLMREQQSDWERLCEFEVSNVNVGWDVENDADNGMVSALVSNKKANKDVLMETLTSARGSVKALAPTESPTFVRERGIVFEPRIKFIPMHEAVTFEIKVPSATSMTICRDKPVSVAEGVMLFKNGDRFVSQPHTFGVPGEVSVWAELATVMAHDGGGGGDDDGGPGKRGSVASMASMTSMTSFRSEGGANPFLDDAVEVGGAFAQGDIFGHGGLSLKPQLSDFRKLVTFVVVEDVQVSSRRATLTTEAMPEDISSMGSASMFDLGSF